MIKSKFLFLISMLSITASCIILSAPQAVAAEKTDFVFGMLLVGPYNDHGWSQAHYDAGKYIESKIANTRMIYIDKVNPAERPGVTIPQLVDSMVEDGAKLIIANSDDMKDGIREAAMMHPNIYFIHASGDDALTGRAPKNLSNIMGRMEYGKMIAGFAAAMTTKTGKIGYLGPLINEETRRLASCCYLGARYAWENVLKKNPKEMKFQVNWIGFWFNIPGVTSDPTQVARNFYDQGFDVVVSGIDTTEAIVVAKQKNKEGKFVRAIPYDYAGACEGVEEVCLGVPYFNWGPEYTVLIKEAMSGKWSSKWIWAEPDWTDINNEDTTAVGFIQGPALSNETRLMINSFIKDMETKKAVLLKGPLFYQDGKPFLKKDEIASDKQVWYMEQLLMGMTGQSTTK